VSKPELIKIWALGINFKNNLKNKCSSMNNNSWSHLKSAGNVAITHIYVFEQETVISVPMKELKLHLLGYLL